MHVGDITKFLGSVFFNGKLDGTSIDIDVNDFKAYNLSRKFSDDHMNLMGVEMVEEMSAEPSIEQHIDADDQSY